MERTEEGHWVLLLRNCSLREAGGYKAVAKSRMGTCQVLWTLSVSEPQPSPTNETNEISIESHTPSSNDDSNNQQGPHQPEEMPLYPHSILKRPSEFPPLPFDMNEDEDETYSLRQNDSLDVILPNGTSRQQAMEFSEFDRPFAKPGTIADREHRKWIEEAVPLQNNPYSKESIEKRLSKNSIDANRHSSVMAESVNSTTDNDLVVNSPEMPRKIDCGPKIANLRRYWRDYYVDSSQLPTSSSSEASQSAEEEEPLVSDNDGRITQRAKVEPDNSEKQSETKVVKPELETNEQSLRNATMSVERRSEDSESDSEQLQDSLDDNNIQDSGVGSSSERTSTMSKVESEILHFQRKIEEAAVENSRAKDWERRKATLRSSSVDSLLSMEESSDCHQPPALPPKGRFMSTEDLLPPPKLPPKQRTSLTKKVSISTNAVYIIGESDTDSCSDMGRKPYNGTNLQPPKPLLKVKANITDGPLMGVVPDVVPKPSQVLFKNESFKGSSPVIGDLPSELPSVRDLATKFMPKKSPEPIPRKSINKRKESPQEKKRQEVRPTPQIHSLTARSVPRQFREGLRKGMPDFTDRNIKIPPLTKVTFATSQSELENEFQEDEEPNGENEHSTQLNIIYDSTNKDSVPYPNAEYIRTPSPEHVGIPAGPVKMPPSRSGGNIQMTLEGGYTSDDSNVSLERQQRRHPPYRRKATKQPSVRSLAEQLNGKS